MSGSIRIEKLGKPGVFAFAESFEHDAEAASKDYGMPTLRRVAVPGYKWLRETREAKKSHAEQSIDDLIRALTSPLTLEEAKPKPLVREPFPPIKITAATYEFTVEEFNQLFLENRWGDGLYLVPPTPERVKWMLTGTSRSPHEVIGTVLPKKGICTIEKIAINAVMAGAKPEYLPVIIAAMEGLTDKDFDLLHVMASMGNFTLAIIVSGPIGKEINMNSDYAFLGYGWRANATIGRAVRLCLLNMGHLWPGVNDMATLGRQHPYTFYAFAENEELNPWKPYHVGEGYKPEDNCVTVSTIGSYGGWAITDFRAPTIKAGLENIIKSISEARKGVFGLFKRGFANPSAHPLKHLILLDPETAKGLQAIGFTTQESLRNYIYEHTSVPYEDLRPEEINNIKDRIAGSKAGDMIFSDIIPPDRIPVFEEALKPGGKVPILITPKDIHVIVAGGKPGSPIGMSYIRAPYKWTSHQTKLIRGATLTKAGR